MNTRPPAAETVVLGERWGCAMTPSVRGPTWHCWRAAAPDGIGETPATWVPWMDGRRQLYAGPDRLCTISGGVARCWQAPPTLQPSAATANAFVDDSEVAAHHGLSGARPINWESAGIVGAPYSPGAATSFVGAGARPSVFVGGTFTCAVAGRPSPAPCARGESLETCRGVPAHDLWCFGDDTFGQRGARGVPPEHPEDMFLATRPPARPLPEQAIPIPFVAVATGTWHACATARDQRLWCWGRNDQGQLGGRGNDLCGPVDARIACATKPRAVPFAVAAGAVPGAGDLFSCITGPATQGILCWGASRDGFFGSKAACPESVRASWPSVNGGPAIRAPNVACAAWPAPVPAFAGLTIDRIADPAAVGHTGALDLGIGPRGACIVHDGHVRCAGAVPTPRAGPLTRVRVSPGQDASACAIGADGAVYCWGEGYSTDPATGVTARLRIEPRLPNSDAAAIDNDGKTGPSCFVHRPCYQKRSLAACATGAAALARPWPALRGDGLTGLEGRPTRVSGTLRAGSGYRTAVGCDDDCCNSSGGPMVVGEETNGLVLDGLGCFGDESRRCCDIVPGQRVIAEGKLRRYKRQPEYSGWMLEDAQLCLDVR